MELQDHLVNQDRMVKLDQLDKLELRDHLGPRGLRETGGRMELQAMRVLPEPLDQQGRTVSPEVQAPSGQQETPGRRGIMERRETPEPLGMQETTELRVHRGPPGRLELTEPVGLPAHLVLQGLPVLLVSLVNQGPQEPQVLPDKTARPDHRVPPVRTVSQDPPDRRDQVVLPDLSDNRDLMATPVKQERLVCRGLSGIRDLRDNQDQLVLLDHLDLMDLPVSREPAVLQGPLDYLEHRVHLEPLDLRVSRD